MNGRRGSVLGRDGSLNRTRRSQEATTDVVRIGQRYLLLQDVLPVSGIIFIYEVKTGV